jgi:hypothetical protein
MVFTSFQALRGYTAPLDFKEFLIRVYSATHTQSLAPKYNQQLG